MGLEQEQWYILLALLNCVVFMACLADWNRDSSVKNLFSMLSWAASMTFWLTRFSIPV